MTIQPVSFGKIATTPKGNEYKKSHVGTITGTIAGLGFGAYNVQQAMKPQNSMSIKRILAPAYASLKQTLPKETAMKLIKNVSIPIGVTMGLAFWGAIGLGIGALVNKAINHHKAAVVDKRVAQLENKLNGTK